MKTRIIEATQGQNWGKFMVGQFDSEWGVGSALKLENCKRSDAVPTPGEWRTRQGNYTTCAACGSRVQLCMQFLDRSAVAENTLLRAHSFGQGAMSLPLLQQRGWSGQHLLVVDLETGEGAIFRVDPHASPPADLNKHRVWVCPMFEPFLTRLYALYDGDVDHLPALMEFAAEEAPFEMAGYRRGAPTHTSASALDALQEHLTHVNTQFPHWAEAAGQDAHREAVRILDVLSDAGITRLDLEEPSV